MEDYYNEELLRRLHPAVREYLDVIVEKEKPLAVYLVGEDTDELEQNCDEYPHGVELIIVNGRKYPMLLEERIRIEDKYQFYLNTKETCWKGFEEYRKSPWATQTDLLYAQPIWVMHEFARKKEKAFIGVPPLDAKVWFRYASRWIAYYTIAMSHEWYDHAANSLGVNVEFLLKSLYLHQTPQGINERDLKRFRHSLTSISKKLNVPHQIEDQIRFLSEMSVDSSHIKYPGGRDFTREEVLRLKAARDRIYEYVRTFFPDVQEDYRPGTDAISGTLHDAPPNDYPIVDPTQDPLH